MNQKIRGDELKRVTRNVLYDFATETLSRGYAIAKVVWAAGDGEWSVPLHFDEFLAVSRELPCAEGQCRSMGRVLCAEGQCQSMGRLFSIYGREIAKAERESPRDLAAARLNWGDFQFDLIRLLGPRTVVVVNHLWWPCPSRLVAYGFHPVSTVGYASSQCADDEGNKCFGPPVEQSVSEHQAFCDRLYHKLFGPGRN